MFERALLAEGERHESTPRHGDVVSTGREVRKLVASFSVGCGAAIDADLGGRKAYLRAPKRSTGIGRNDTAANPPGAGRRFCRNAIARRQLRARHWWTWLCSALRKRRRLRRGKKRKEKNPDGQSTRGIRSHPTSGGAEG